MCPKQTISFLPSSIYLYLCWKVALSDKRWITSLTRDVPLIIKIFHSFAMHSTLPFTKYAYMHNYYIPRYLYHLVSQSSHAIIDGNSIIVYFMTHIQVYVCMIFICHSNSPFHHLYTHSLYALQALSQIGLGRVASHSPTALQLQFQSKITYRYNLRGANFPWSQLWACVPPSKSMPNLLYTPCKLVTLIL